MSGTKVWVRRERPTVLAWSIALAVTMLAVYVLTLSASLPEAAKKASAEPRVTRVVDLRAREGWCVSLGNWPTAAQARIEAAGYAAMGAAGCAWEADGAWRVLGAMYASEGDARRSASRLRDDEAIEADVLRLRAEGVKLRITAPERQVELIQSADDLLGAQAEKLSEMALALDRGRVQPEAARTLCALTATEAEAIRAALAGIPGAADNALCAGLLDALTRLSRHLGEIAESAQTAPPALSGMLRMAGIDSLISLKAAREKAAL